MSTTPTFYIFHGDDDFRMGQVVQKMRDELLDVDSAGLNVTELDGSQVNAAEALSAVSAFPFLADRRLVIVRGMIGWITRKGAGETGKKQVDRLVEDLPHLPDYARLVFVEKTALRKNSRLLKLANDDPNGYEKLFEAPKAGDMPRWLRERAKSEYDVVLEPAAAAGLASVIGGDLRRADNELVKLVSYTDGNPIDEDTVALLTPYTSEANVWRMVDAMAVGHGQEAMTLLHKLLGESGEDPFRLWGLLVRQFRLMLLAKEHLENGGGVGDLASALGIAPFAAKKLPGQVSKISLQDLETVYRRLLDYDVKMKTGGIDATLALDLLVAGMART